MKAQPDAPHKPSLVRRLGQLPLSLGHEVGAELIEQNASLRKAMAENLQSGMLVANLGTGFCCLIFGLIYWQKGLHNLTMVWWTLGISSSILRSYLLWGFSRGDRHLSEPPKTTTYLRLCALAAALGGCMFGWGWLEISPHLTNAEIFAFAFVNATMLFGGLYAYSVYLPAYVGFSCFSLIPALVFFNRTELNGGELVGILIAWSLLYAVSLLFCFRTAKTFSTNHLLQQRVFRLLEELTQKRDEAVTATLAKSRFLASVSHDLRQPMHAINLYLSSLAINHEKYQQNYSDHSAKIAVQASIDNLKESTIYLNAMFEALLDISRLDSVQIDVRPQYVTLMRMISLLEADYSKLAQHQGLRFEVNLPKQFHLMEVHTDPAMLERLLRNLLVNAFRYTQKGGVRLAVVQRGKRLDFRVIDTGPGIESSLRTRVFEEFFQIPGSQTNISPSSNTGRGIGLGLSIASRLARLLESRVRLHTHLGLGSVFAVEMPYRFALRPKNEQIASSNTDLQVKFPPNTFMAVIDDDPEILRSTRMLLESHDVAVFTATTGKDAIRHLGQFGRIPNLIISDYRLGLEDGIQVILQLREEFNTAIPAMLITGDTSSELVSVFKSSGFTLLHKPISGEQLIEAAAQLMNSPIGDS